MYCRRFLKQTVAPKSSKSLGCVQKQPTAYRLCPLSFAQAAKAHGVPASASTRIEGLVSPSGKPYVILGIVWATLEIADGVHDRFPPLCFFQVTFQALRVCRQNGDKKRHASCYLRQRLHPWDAFVMLQPPQAKIRGVVYRSKRIGFENFVLRSFIRISGIMIATVTFLFLSACRLRMLLDLC